MWKMCSAFLNLKSHFFVFLPFREAFSLSLEQSTFVSLKISLREESIHRIPHVIICLLQVFPCKAILTSCETVLTFKALGHTGEPYLRFKFVIGMRNGGGGSDRMMCDVFINRLLKTIADINPYSVESTCSNGPDSFFLSGQ